MGNGYYFSSSKAGFLFKSANHGVAFYLGDDFGGGHSADDGKDEGNAGEPPRQYNSFADVVFEQLRAGHGIAKLNAFVFASTAGAGIWIVRRGFGKRFFPATALQLQ